MKETTEKQRGFVLGVMFMASGVVLMLLIHEALTKGVTWFSVLVLIIGVLVASGIYRDGMKADP